ncbi:ATP-dependent nuclease [Pseudomonas soli]|uniref:ATP-dependent nuclease n=1 Tax=Pseudomonas soli TaxID=1306993 RepID=UPI0028AEEDAF|nr:AAA family ATPase [Pseudomonas soli]
MRIAYVQIQNFRGITALSWSPGTESICCIIGPGDSSKTTVLDAVEAVLSPRWITFSEADFVAGDTEQEIQVEVTVTELSQALLADNRFGLYIRGISPDGTVHDEPEDGDEPALTVRLSVDATMEPVWALICERYAVPRILSNRDRAMFCLVRLAGEESRHLTWAQGSMLARMTGRAEGAAQQLAAAYRSARQNANLDSIPELVETAQVAEGYARGIGAYINSRYRPDLELGRGGFNSGSIALHDGTVPLRLAGLGTRRLATLAVQRSALQEGAIVLVDELEQGLEPHRILGAVSQLKRSQTEAAQQNLPIGQILMTTHSDVVVSELNASSLFIMRKTQATGASSLQQASLAGDLTPIMKHSPRSLFGRRILICEGATELGLMLGIRDFYPARHDDVPVEHHGAAIIDGKGAAAPPLARALSILGYPVALFRDSDRPLDARWRRSLQDLNVQIIEYTEGLNTEQAIFQAAPNDLIDLLLALVRGFINEHNVRDQLLRAIPGLNPQAPFAEWELIGDDTHERNALSSVAVANNWFKTEARGRAISPAINQVIARVPQSPLAQCLSSVERWLYA